MAQEQQHNGTCVQVVFSVIHFCEQFFSYWVNLPPTFFLMLTFFWLLSRCKQTIGDMFCTELVHHNNLEKQGQTRMHLINMNAGVQIRLWKCSVNTSAGRELLAERCRRRLWWQLNSPGSWPAMLNLETRFWLKADGFRLKWGHVRSAPPSLVFGLNNECSSFLYN